MCTGCHGERPGKYLKVSLWHLINSSSLPEERLVFERLSSRVGVIDLENLRNSPSLSVPWLTGCNQPDQVRSVSISHLDGCAVVVHTADENTPNDPQTIEIPDFHPGATLFPRPNESTICVCLSSKVYKVIRLIGR